MPGESRPCAFEPAHTIEALILIQRCLLTCCPSIHPQTKRTATAGGARGIALYEDEAISVNDLANTPTLTGSSNHSSTLF